MRWRRAASTTTSAEASPATRSTSDGSCRTSRRCSTTKRCSFACTPTPRRRRTSPGGARSSPRPSSTWSATYGSREVDSPRPRMPTPPDRTATTTRDCSTRGRPPRSPTVIGAESTAVCEFYDITAAGNFEQRSIPNRIGRWPRRLAAAAGDRSGPPDAVRRPPRASPAGPRRQGAHRVERPDDLVTRRGRRVRSANRHGSTRPSTPPDFLLTELRTDDGRWRRAWHEGGEPRARHDALAADHAALADAFVRLAEATGEALVDRRGDGGRRHDARPLLGRRPWRTVHDR